MTDSRSLRMTNETLREKVFDAIEAAYDPFDNGGILNSSTATDNVLAALGLDDLDAAVKRGAGALNAEVAHRNEWYGLDNWTFGEVAAFVLEAALTATEEGQP